ncbi:HAD hydrolase-like protein [Sutcliffiella halmapala]|uniref:HAD hydrolase-like protein n=1 Tax=Sutcliffiella halmapala TaxID=79882 RepID=UPI00099581C7|nr:HAD hydrolase-like protein [Sutcliffiella halmapala]
MGSTMIFDMDGTLFQTNIILEASLDETFTYLKSLNYWEGSTPIEKYREIMGVPIEVVWETLLPNHSNEVRTIANEHFHADLITKINEGKGALYPNAVEILSYLKDNNYSIFIASNGVTEYLNAIVKYYNLDEWVIEVFSIQQIQSQNKADLVQTILKKYNIVNGAVIGDRLTDIKAAKSNGLTAIGCNFDFAQEAELAQSDVVIDDLGELKAIIPALSIKNS